ncbi:MAG: PAS domain-containing protein [Opitutaceae bacterium]|nr:PAS domain-containing protein [Opitutaceae bacterium]
MLPAVAQIGAGQSAFHPDELPAPSTPLALLGLPFDLHTLPLWIALAGAIAAWIWERHSVSRLNRQSRDLASSQHRIALVLEASQDGFWDFDVASGYVERSPRWLEMLGYTEADGLTSEAAFLAIVHPDDLSYVRERLEAMREPEHPVYSRFEYRIRDRMGMWRWFMDRAKIVSRDPHGWPLRIVGTGSDITERKRTENELKRSQSLFRQSQEVSGVGGWELDVAHQSLFWTHETFRIHDLDPAQPYPTVEEAIGFYAPKSQPIIREAARQAIESGSSFDLELQLITARKRSLWVRSIGRAERDCNGKVVRLYGSFQDITARKEDESSKAEFQDKLLETQKLESLGVLAGGVAHDFNNILTAILANAQLCRHSIDEGSESDKHLEAIEKASFRAADLCHQLLAYAGRNPVTRQQTDLNRLVRETTQLLELSIGKLAQLELDLSPHSSVIEVDHAQMSQIMMNLVINASEALPAYGGIIRIRTGSTWLTADMLEQACIGQNLPAGQFAFLEVSDTGCGMNEETLAKIFDPFFTTKFTGRGLGLAAVLGIVRAHSGCFFVESVLSEGSTFRMCLPLLNAPLGSGLPPTSPAPHLSEAQRHALRILLVDDEPEIRAVTAEILQLEGFSVETASDGIEAVELFHRRPETYDLVILDLTMPGLDGVGALKQLRSLRSAIRVILMSGYSDRESALGDLLNESTLFLRKPFARENLMERISQVLSGEVTEGFTEKVSP